MCINLDCISKVTNWSDALEKYNIFHIWVWEVWFMYGFRIFLCSIYLFLPHFPDICLPSHITFTACAIAHTPSAFSSTILVHSSKQIEGHSCYSSFSWAYKPCAGRGKELIFIFLFFYNIIKMMIRIKLEILWQSLNFLSFCFVHSGGGGRVLGKEYVFVRLWKLWKKRMTPKNNTVSFFVAMKRLNYRPYWQTILYLYY